MRILVEGLEYRVGFERQIFAEISESDGVDWWGNCRCCQLGEISSQL